ncbi:unnamed protein product, partial [Ectocarpus sp. 12 AP-2014]
PADAEGADSPAPSPVVADEKQDPADARTGVPQAVVEDSTPTTAVSEAGDTTVRPPPVSDVAEDASRPLEEDTVGSADDSATSADAEGADSPSPSPVVPDEKQDPADAGARVPQAVVEGSTPTAVVSEAGDAAVPPPFMSDVAGAMEEDTVGAVEDSATPADAEGADSPVPSPVVPDEKQDPADAGTGVPQAVVEGSTPTAAVSEAEDTAAVSLPSLADEVQDASRPPDDSKRQSAGSGNGEGSVGEKLLAGEPTAANVTEEITHDGRQSSEKGDDDEESSVLAKSN